MIVVYQWLVRSEEGRLKYFVIYPEGGGIKTTSYNIVYYSRVFISGGEGGDTGLGQ